MVRNDSDRKKESGSVFSKRRETEYNATITPAGAWLRMLSCLSSLTGMLPSTPDIARGSLFYE